MAMKGKEAATWAHAAADYVYRTDILGEQWAEAAKASGVDKAWQSKGETA